MFGLFLRFVVVCCCSIIPYAFSFFTACLKYRWIAKHELLQETTPTNCPNEKLHCKNCPGWHPNWQIFWNVCIIISCAALFIVTFCCWFDVLYGSFYFCRRRGICVEINRWTEWINKREQPKSVCQICHSIIIALFLLFMSFACCIHTYMTPPRNGSLCFSIYSSIVRANGRYMKFAW